MTYRTVTLFTEYGNGTPAPFDPPKKFVVRGLYRYVRNPMMIGVMSILFGESILFNSLFLLYWAIFFIVANLIYIPLIEEPELKIRFGMVYEDYLSNTPRWIPRQTPWNKK